MRQKLPFEIYRTAVDIQGLFATGAGRAPSAVGQPEQVFKKAFELILQGVFLTGAPLKFASMGKG